MSKLIETVNQTYTTPIADAVERRDAGETPYTCTPAAFAAGVAAAAGVAGAAAAGAAIGQAID